MRRRASSRRSWRNREPAPRSLTCSPTAFPSTSRSGRPRKAMQGADVIIIGAGQAGLAMSRQLGALGIDHVILERGRVAERWRTTSWRSLRLLTPNWMTRLPDWQYRGDDPDGYMDCHAFARFLTDYAGATAAPVVPDAPVTRVSMDGSRRYAVETPVGTWRCRAVV